MSGPLAWPERTRRLVTGLLLIGVLLLGAGARLWQMWPPARGLDYAPDTDEGAYVYSAQLMLQGEMPYRDFFATLPPGGLYLFALVLRLFYHGNGSLAGFMALRYASIVYGLGTLLAVYGIGRRLGGRPAGLLAAAVLALDGIVIAQDRRAMLETPMNLCSALAIWAYLEATIEAQRSRLALVLAGALSALAVMLKSPAAVVPLVLVAASLRRRRWADLPFLLAGGLLGGLLLAGPYLLACPQAFLKQVYLFQLVRPPDGVLSVGERLHELWGYPYAWLTLRLWAVGALLALTQSWGRREWAGWVVILGWAGGTLALILSSQSYWATYYAQLAVPLAVLAGGALARGGRVEEGAARPALRRWAPALLLAAFALYGIPHYGVQWGATRTLLSFNKPEFGAVTAYLRQNAPAEAAVLATDPLYGMLAGLPLAHALGRPFMPDSYGGMLYRNLGLDVRGLGELAEVKAELAAYDVSPAELSEAVFHAAPAQADVRAALAEAHYVVIDRRARRQWAPETLGAVEKDTTLVLSVGDTELRAR